MFEEKILFKSCLKFISDFPLNSLTFFGNLIRSPVYFDTVKMTKLPENGK